MFVGETLGKETSWNTHRWEDNIKRDLREVGLGMDYIGLAQDRDGWPNRVIKSRRLRWAGHVARMGERRGAYRALVGKPE
jgi:hypothetical protein